MKPLSPNSLPSGLLEKEVVRFAWNQTAAGLCLVGANGEVQQCNWAFADLVGHSEADLVGMPLLRLQPAEHAMAMQALHREIIEQDDPAVWVAKETYFSNSRGRPIVTYSRNARSVNAKGEVQRLITVVDLSDIARANRRFEMINQIETHAALSTTVSNDLNNLLSIILGYTALLRDGSSDLRRQQVVAEGVDGAVQRATSLVKQSLYMMRRPEPVPQKTDLGKFLENKLQVVRAEIGDRPVELELSMVPELKAVPLDTMQLGEAVGEMIRRLHQFERDTTRGLRTRTRWQAGSLVRQKFSQADARTYAIIELINPGRPRLSSRPPMPLETVSEENSKHDLGLTMIERIIETHQGFLEYIYESGGAAIYTVWLPLGAEVEFEAGETSSSAGADSAGDVGHKDRGKLLMVDDEEGLLATMASSLRDRGYEVITATDGESALLEHREHAKDLDLVITDLVLPGLSGWEVFTGIREASPDLPVLIMSGHLEPKLEAAVNRSGAAGFVQKPFGLNLLLKRVRELLRTRSSSGSGDEIGFLGQPSKR